MKWFISALIISASTKRDVTEIVFLRIGESSVEGHLLVGVGVLHSAIELGQFHTQDDAWDEKQQAPAQAEPERVLASREERKVLRNAKKRRLS